MIRNSELKHITLFCLIASAAFSAVGFCLFGSAGWLVLLSCSVFSAFIFIISRSRLRSIAKLSDQFCAIMHGETVLDISGEAEGDLSILKSEIYKMTVTLREQAEQLMAEKQALADSLSDISHQLKTPLTSMMITASLMTGEKDEATLGGYIRDIESLIQGMSFLVSSLLKISRLDAGMAGLVSNRELLKDVVEKACAPLLILMELREVNLTVEGDPEASFTGDINWMAEALTKVIKNCMEHTPSGGTVTVNYSENPLFSLITVLDTGGGISRKDLPHIFDRFYRGENAAEGSVGIGLALARRIAEEHNGTLSAHNSGKGAVFELRIYK